MSNPLRATKVDVDALAQGVFERLSEASDAEVMGDALGWLVRSATEVARDRNAAQPEHWIFEKAGVDDDALRAAMNALSLHRRWTLHLYLYLGSTVEEIARAQRRSPAAVRSDLKAALSLLNLAAQSTPPTK